MVIIKLFYRKVIFQSNVVNILKFVGIVCLLAPGVEAIYTLRGMTTTFFTFCEINFSTAIKFQYHKTSKHQRSEGIRTVMYSNE